MEARERTCILCGTKEVMAGFICGSCQERIQQEVVNRRAEMRKQAKEALRQAGRTPDSNKSE